MQDENYEPPGSGARASAYRAPEVVTRVGGYDGLQRTFSAVDLRPAFSSRLLQ